MCVPQALSPRTLLLLRQRKLSVCSAKCCDLCAASRFLVQSNVHYFVHTDTVYMCFEYHSPRSPFPSILFACFLPSFRFGMRLRPWGQVQNATNAAVFTSKSHFEWKRCAAMHKLMAGDNRVLTKHSCTQTQTDKWTEREKFALEFRCELFEKCSNICMIDSMKSFE